MSKSESDLQQQQQQQQQQQRCVITSLVYHDKLQI
jgi:hypothetical protein